MSGADKTTLGWPMISYITGTPTSPCTAASADVIHDDAEQTPHIGYPLRRQATTLLVCADQPTILLWKINIIRSPDHVGISWNVFAP